MGYPPIEELLPKSGFSLYKLVRMAANRAIELAEGGPKLIECPRSEKTATVALEEIKAGKVVLKSVADQFEPPVAPKKGWKKKEENAESEMSVS